MSDGHQNIAAAGAAVVLAAGKSTRMKSDLPKVMHAVCGRPMLSFVLEACRQAGLGRIVVVVGHGKQAVLDAFGGEADLAFVEQTEQKGTGHAVMMAREALASFRGAVVVIAGDMPLIRPETLRELISVHQQRQARASLATTHLDEPFSYGRILRDAAGAFLGIVEERDCTDEQRRLGEVNPSYYCFDREALFTALDEVRPNNAKNEYYITDVFQILRKRGERIVAEVTAPAADAIGINSRADLAEVAGVMQARIQAAVMDSGVTIVSPPRTWIEAGAVIGADSTIEPFTFVGSGARIGRGCRIGPFGWVAAGQTVRDGASVRGEADGGAALRAPALTGMSGLPEGARR